MYFLKALKGLEELKEGFQPGKEDHMNILMGQTKGARNEEDSTSLIGKHPQELLGIIGNETHRKYKI